MDVDLPVWTVRPNWAQGVLERLEWLTDVLPSDTGAEQRRAVRLTPRRSFEITVNPTRAERTYLDLVLHRLGSESWYFPLWHDQAALTASAGTHTFRLEIDNTFREFQDGGFAILYLSTFEWDVVQIASQDDTGLNLANPGNSAKAWPKGTKVYPLRVATLQTDTAIKAITSRVGESVLLFTVNEANPYPEMSGGAMTMYDGSPILTLAPNRSEEITSSHTRLTDEADGGIGLRYRLDSAGRAFAVQSHNWQIKGREAHADFRSFLYTLNGRQKVVWLPSFNDDLFLARPVAAAATRADIENIGLKYVGGSSPIPGRATFWTGREVVKHAGFSTPLGAGEERLNLLAPTTYPYAVGQAWSFMEAARLDQDTIELHHYTDSDGVMEISAGFHTFANTRDAAGSYFLPIPVEDKGTTSCGTPIGLNPCVVLPPPWYHRMILDAFDRCNEAYGTTRLLGHPPGADGSGDSLGTGYGIPFTILDGDGNPRVLGRALGDNPNMSWVIDFYYPITAGTWSQVLQYPAFFCGSVHKDAHHIRISMQNRTDPIATVVVEDWAIGGNFPYSIDWEWA